MKRIFAVLFSVLFLSLASGCQVIVDKGSGVIHTKSVLGSMSHGYVDHSGLSIVNPGKSLGIDDLRMEVTYAICTRLNRSNERWGASQRYDPYPIAEVYRGSERGSPGGDVFISAANLTNHRNILRVTVDFYRGSTKIGRTDRAEIWAYFYRGVWQSEWHPYP